MSKKTLLLVLFLLFITSGLLVAAFLPNKPKIVSTTIAPPLTSPIPTPTPAAKTILSFSPNPLIIASRSGSLNLAIDTETNNVTAMQIELLYDPKALTNVAISPGTFFDDPITLIKNTDSKNGKITYVLAMSPASKAQSGKGVVATLSFTTIVASGEKTQISFSPKTLVTAEKIPTSVLKATDSATIFYVQQASTINEEVGPFKPVEK